MGSWLVLRTCYLIDLGLGIWERKDVRCLLCMIHVYFEAHMWSLGVLWYH